MSVAWSGRYGNTPSRNVLRNLVTKLQLLVPNKDEDGSQPSTSQPINPPIPCSVQPGNLVREFVQAAIREFIPYLIYFDRNPLLSLGDTVLWVDDVGATHKIIIIGCRNAAGLGASFVAEGEERL